VTVAESAPQADMRYWYSITVDKISTDTERHAGPSALAEALVSPPCIAMPKGLYSTPVVFSSFFFFGRLISQVILNGS